MMILKSYFVHLSNPSEWISSLHSRLDELVTCSTAKEL